LILCKLVRLRENYVRIPSQILIKARSCTIIVLVEKL